MLEKQIWNHNFPQFWFTNFRQYSGRFGLYGLEGQTKGITQILNTSWLQLGEKIMKIQLFSLSGLWCDLQKFLWPFCIFLRSLMPKKFSGMQKSYFWTGFHHQTLTNQISNSESLWTRGLFYWAWVLWVLKHPHFFDILFLSGGCQLPQWKNSIKHSAPAIF